MFALIVQTVLLMAIAFILGCVLGCVLHRLFGSANGQPVAAKSADAPAVEPASYRTVPPVEPAAAPKPAPVPQVAVAPVEKAPVVPVAPIAGLAAAQPATAKSAPKPRVTKPKEKPAVVVADGPPDNLKMIRGIGPQNEGRLNKIGVHRFAQIATWTKKEQREIGEALAFPGRIEREEWVSQARKLAKGGATAFSKRVAEGSVTTSVGAPFAGTMGKKPGNLLSAPRGGKADNLTMIDGVGSAIEKKLFKLGVYHFDQIVEMKPEGLSWLGTAVGFPGRAERENWQAESRVLAQGGSTPQAGGDRRGQIKPSRKT
ncbi:hypothetical protein N9H93_00895 [Rhizobiaceae bacterium]|nr:hypothetical protein [Rhizobiaceae bacterium]